jgi:hypothetical protein
LRGRILYHQQGTCQKRPQKPLSVADSGDVTETTVHETGDPRPPRANWLANAQTCDASGWFRGNIDQVVADHHEAIWLQLARLADPTCVAGDGEPINAGRLICGRPERARHDPRIDTAMTVYLVKHDSKPADPAEPWFQYVRRPGFLEIRTPGRPLAWSYLAIVCVIHLVVSGALVWDRADKCWRWSHPKPDELRAWVESLVDQPLTEQTDWRARLVAHPTGKLSEVRFVVRS